MFSHAEYAALQESAGILDRTRRGRILLTGGDRRAYLHGQLTNDIVALSAGSGCYAALLTPQGRMISDMRVSELGDAILLDLPAATADAVRTRLEELIFTEDVRVEDASASLTHVAVYGPRAAEILAASLERASIPDSGDGNDAVDARLVRLEGMHPHDNSRWHFGGSAVVAIRSDDYGVAGFEVFLAQPDGSPAALPALLSSFRRHGAVDVAAESAHVTRVEAGRPEFGIDMDEHTIPLEAGIQDRAISMTKGCYVGQEVIVRVLHRGQGRVARRLVGFIAGAGLPVPARGQRLRASDESAKDIGVVTSAVFSPRLRRPIGLGYLQRDFTEPGTIVHASGETHGGSAALTVVTVPFTA